MNEMVRAGLNRLQPFIAASVLMFLKALLLRYFLFGQIAWSQVPADAASILFLAGLFELLSPDRWKTVVLGTLNFIVSLLFFASVLYFNYFSTIPIYTALSGAGQLFEVKDSVEATFQWKNALFFLDSAALMAVWSVLRIRGVRLPAMRPGRVWKLGILALTVLSFVVSGLYVSRAGGIANELAKAEEIGFFNYQVSAAWEAREAVAKGKQAKPDELESLSRAAIRAKDVPEAFGSMKGKNLIVIQLEAFQNFPIHLSVNGQAVTPVLNELADNGYYFPKFFQQIGQGNTADAEFLANTSIYPTAKEAMSTGYGDRELPSLPRLLKSYDYVSETFHVNDVTFWDRNRMYPALGFDRYFDRPSFDNDNFNAFGASDIELYRTAVNRAVEHMEANQPFYFHLVTASSHHPFRIPQDKQWLELPEEFAGTQLGDYLQAVHYTDYAVGELIRMLKENGLYDDTVIVLYGDHFGLQPNDNDPEAIKRLLGITYHERISRFNVPLIIHVPGTPPKKTVDTVGGQVDILPTVANLLGISLKDENFTVFGHDLLNTERNVIGMRYYLPTGSFFNNEVMFVPGKSFEDGTAVSLETLQPVGDLSSYRTDYDYVMKLLELSDAYVESLPKR